MYRTKYIINTCTGWDIKSAHWQIRVKRCLQIFQRVVWQRFYGVAESFLMTVLQIFC